MMMRRWPPSSLVDRRHQSPPSLPLPSPSPSSPPPPPPPSSASKGSASSLHWWLSIALFFGVIIRLTHSCEVEYKLVHDLLADYDRSIRPSRHYSEVLNVTFGLALAQIIDVDERNMIITTNAWLNQAWIDDKLKWNSSEYGGIKVIRIPASKIWKPDIILYNNADPLAASSVISTNVIINNNGNVTWLCTVIFKSSCSINVRYFPFDEQNCSMLFASWTYDGFQVNIQHTSDKGDLSNYVQNGEWELIALHVERHVKYYSCCEEPYPDITYTIQMRRRPLFYVFNMVLPCILITGVAFLGFYMPADSGEKVNMGITTLLSITVFLMLVAESMPPTSDVLPLIGIYYGAIIAIVSLATAMTVLTLNIHHKGIRGKEVPSLIKKICFGILAKILFLKLETPDHDPELLRPKPQRVFETSVHEAHETERAPLTVSEANGGIPGSPMSPQFSRGRILLKSMGSPSAGSDNFERQFARVLHKVYQTIERNEMRLCEQERRELIKLEWYQVAYVLDRLLLWIFVIVTTAVSCYILLQSPHSTKL